MTSKTLKLSIVIPVYNEQNYLKACLDSIAAQTINPLEVLVVDNNSTDSSAKLAGAYPFVTLLKEPKQGTVFARNRGFNAARGDIIGRIDADTILLPDWLEKTCKLFNDDMNIAAITGPCYFNVIFGRTAVLWLHRLIYFWSSRLLFGHTTLFGSNMSIRRSVWLVIAKKVCMRTDIHEDMDLAHHLSQQKLHVVFRQQLTSTVSVKMFRHPLHYPVMWIRTRLVHAGKSSTFSK